MTSADQPSFQLRLTILIVVVACLFGALFSRLWFLQIINVPSAQAVAEDNGVRIFYTPAPRGEILDRNGNVLVGNVEEPVIEVNRLTAAANPNVAERLAPLLGMTVSQLNRAIDNTQYSPYAPVPVMPDATPQQILYIQENQSLFPGVQATTLAVRTYSTMGKAAANIVGYVGQINAAQLAQLKSQGYQPGDQIGLAGVESSYESVLRGSPGVEKVQVDSQGNVLTTLSTTPPVPGDNLRLSIDGRVQMVADDALAQGMAAARGAYDKVTNRKFEAPAASAVVEDPKTGQIIALATDPSYDPSEWVGGISYKNFNLLKNNKTDPLLDRTIQGQYAPGSTFKLITAIAGLKYNVITPTSPFVDTGCMKIGTTPACNDNRASYGTIDLPEAITVSSDLYFDTVGLDLWYDRAKFGDDALQQVANEFGLGTPTGIKLPNEAPGKIPTPQSYLKDHEANPKVFQQGEWLPGDSGQVAIGQDEDLVTPLQLANAYATFANGGTYYTPLLVEDTETAAKKVVRTYAPEPQRTIPIAPAWRAAMLQGFMGVAQDGNGTAAAVFNRSELASYDIAGKTGTAQVNAPRQDTSVFTSFAPASNPQYVVDAFMEDSGYGASDAAPVVREIYESLYNLPLQPVVYAGTNGGGQN